MKIRTARLVLREFRSDDAARVFAYQSQYDGEPAALDEAQRLVDLFCDWAEASPRTKYQLAITLDSHLIGTCGVRKETEESATAEFGCELDRDFHGRGLAREASEAILRFAFDELRIERVTARTTPDNVAAIRLAESLGLHVELEDRPQGHGSGPGVRISHNSN
jgi:[ribosomal protein S5]-alanine N-acetyltransferase